jgi:uncharacterized protein (TIGR00255 family)
MLQELIEGVLKDLTVMKVIEGKALLKDIEMRLHEIAASLHAIERHVPQTVSRYQQKLEERLREALCLDVKEDERLLKEVVIYAEKLDITEEIVRLQSHLKQFFELVHSEEKSVGRTLDFLTQEMNREINTMAAKSVDADVSLLAVKMKSELEKIREQIQNIE